MLIVHALPQLPSFSWLLLASVPALLPWRFRASYTVLVFGVLWCSWRVGDDVARRWPVARHGEEVVASGHIASLPEAGDITPRGERSWRFQFDADDDALPLVRASWYRADAEPRAGECWRLKLRLRTPHGSLNPGGFDYEQWLFRQGIGATATVREAERCEGVAGPPWLRLRQALRDRYRQWLPQHPGLPLLAAMTIGDDSGLTDRDWHTFRLSGTSHLVAISGFNVAIVAGVAFFIGRWLWVLWPALCLRLPAQKAGMVASALVGLAYAFLAGWEAPVQRAALMLLALLVAAWFDRLRDAARVLALVWLAMLLLDPMAVSSPGLWLSFGAVAAIFYATLHRVALGGAIREAVRVQWMLSLALLPLSLFFFSGTAWMAPFVNFVAVPFAMVLTPLALLAVFAAWAMPAVGIPLLGVTASALERSQAGLAWLTQHLPYSWWAAGPPWPALVLAAIGIVMAFAPRGLPLRLPALLCLLPLLMPPKPAPAQGFELTVLDVGQGLSLVVQTRHHALLYDAGPAFEDGFDAGASVVAPYLLQAGLRRIDALVLSHGDQDHAGGVPAVRERIGIAREVGTDRGEPCHDGLRWEWDGVRFEFLHPGEERRWSDNNGSCVMRIDDGRHSLLLTGDIESAAEARLLAVHRGQLAADVLVAPHHGSRNSSTDDFVAAVRPRWVVYGAGWRNSYRHPRPEVVERYAAVGARQYVTGVSGALKLVPGEEGWAVEQYRLGSAHWWNAPAEP